MRSITKWDAWLKCRSATPGPADGATSKTLSARSVVPSTWEFPSDPSKHSSRYHDGRPDEPGKNWWGTVTGFQPPGSLDFHHTIEVRQLRAIVDVHIHYSFEPGKDQTTSVHRWLVLDVKMPLLFRPLRRAITAKFNKENIRTMDSLKRYAEHSSSPEVPGSRLSANGRD